VLSPKKYVEEHLHKLEDYISSVTGGSLTTGKLQRLAVERFIEYKNKYEFKESELIRILKFCSFLNIPLDNQIQQVQLLGWQLLVIASLYCLCHGHGNRVHDLAYIEISKKQGKTTLCAILSLIDALIDGELNASVNVCCV
jgi:phage terminase large subunit-like protein